MASIKRVINLACFWVYSTLFLLRHYSAAGKWQPLLAMVRQMAKMVSSLIASSSPSLEIALELAKKTR